MSQKGLNKAAAVFSLLQNTRIELIAMGTKENDHQDINLGQMLEDGHQAMKDRFLRLTLRGTKGYK